MDNALQDRKHWYVIHAPSTRLFQPGEWLEAGTLLGLAAPEGQQVHVEEAGRVAEIQYDIWHERLALRLVSSPCLARTA